MKVHSSQQKAIEGRDVATRTATGVTMQRREGRAASISGAWGESSGQHAAFGHAPAASIRAIAKEGVRGRGGELPYRRAIQRSFGRHDLASVQAYIGGASGAAAEAIGAEAYTFGRSVVFRAPPSLRTAAHEAAHVIQQRAGVALLGHVGRAGDAYERHADAVAEAVVQGQTAETLLSAPPTGNPLIGGSAAFALGAIPSVQALPRDRQPRPEAADLEPRDLLYGFTEPRDQTRTRLAFEDNRRDTIDDYTRDLGITSLLERDLAPAKLFSLRCALEGVHNVLHGNALRRLRQRLIAADALEANQDASLHRIVNAWTQEMFPGRPRTLQKQRLRMRNLRDRGLDNGALIAFMLTLVEAKERVGLYDFAGVRHELRGIPRAMYRWATEAQDALRAAWSGEPRVPAPLFAPYGSLAPLENDRVINKNLEEDLGAGEPITRFRHILSWWLRPERRSARQAADELELAGVTEPEVHLLDQWITKQVLRRTSKLGLDFALRHLRSQVFFNLDGPDFEAETLENLHANRMRFRDDIPADAPRHQPITISELNYLDKLLTKHPELRGQVHFYNEGPAEEETSVVQEEEVPVVQEEEVPVVQEEEVPVVQEEEVPVVQEEEVPVVQEEEAPVAQNERRRTPQRRMGWRFRRLIPRLRRPRR